MYKGCPPKRKYNLNDAPILFVIPGYYSRDINDTTVNSR